MVSLKCCCFFLNLGSSSLFTLVGVGIQYPDGCYAHGETNLMALSGADVVLEDCLHACDVSCRCFTFSSQLGRNIHFVKQI